MRPVSTMPDIELVLGGRSVSRADLHHLTRVRVVEKLSHPAQCEVAFTCSDPGFPDRYPCPGRSLLSLFLRGEIHPLFNGVVTAVEYRYDSEGVLIYQVRGYDALYFSGKKQHVRTHRDMTVPDMARDMVGESGIDILALDQGPVWRQLVQYRETDLDFLARTAQRSGLYFTMNRSGILEIIGLSGNGERVILTRGQDLFELSVETNDAPVLASVHAGGWDPCLAEYHDSRATGQNGLGQDRKLVDIPVRNAAEAEAVARAERDRLKAHETWVRGVADGNSRLAPGVTVMIDNIHPLLQRTFVLAEVRHSLSPESGFLSEFSSVPPDVRPVDSGTGATFGRITDIGDPERLGRVRASLPSFDNVETDWMNVVLPAAGNSKGAVLLPDVGDQVLILFLNNDPARGVVAGGVFGSSSQPEDWGIDGASVKRFTLVTPGGQKITLDDGQRGIRAENHDGSYVELYPDKVTIHAETDLLIEAPKKNITVLGDTIDFRKD